MMEDNTYEIKKDILAFNLFELMKTTKHLLNCDDKLCDDEDCVLFKALKQYMEHEIDEENKVLINLDL